MAHRLYKGWTANKKENSAKTLCLIKILNNTRIKSSFFSSWKASKKKSGVFYQQEAFKPKPGFQYPEKPGKTKTSLSRNNSFHVLDDNSSFQRLYLQGSSKNQDLVKQERAKELDECTFRPEISVHGHNSSSVYARFTPTELKEKEELYRNQKAQKELEGCTFQPKISNKALSLDRSFEKLYKDAEVHRQKMRTKELVEKDKEISNCTFRPVVLNPSKSVTGNVYEKLYNSYQESQREKRRLQLEKEAKETEEHDFIPKLVTPKKQTDSVPAFIRLYADGEKKKEQMRKIEEEKNRPSSATRRQAEEPPRYEALYALHKESSLKKMALQEKVMKDAGVSFKPDMSKRSTPKKSRESPLRGK